MSRYKKASRKFVKFNYAWLCVQPKLFIHIPKNAGSSLYHDAPDILKSKIIQFQHCNRLQSAINDEGLSFTPQCKLDLKEYQKQLVDFFQDGTGTFWARKSMLFFGHINLTVSYFYAPKYPMNY